MNLIWAQLWQITAVIVIVAVVTRLVAVNRPYLSHALWLVVLVKCITPPVFSSPAGVFCWMQPWADSTTDVCQEVLPCHSILSSRVQTDVGPVILSPTASSAESELWAKRNATGDVVEPRWWIAGASIWAGGSVAICLATGVWLALGLRRLRRDGCRVDRRLQRLTDSLARRLGLRRRVRVVVTESRIGPAVFGLFRPTILLPEVIVRGQAADEIEPIVAHELIHIRRGDLWVGLLQTVAQAAWWFHPLVWSAGRLIYREAERCCDEAVVAELGCSPARYARSLLEVLARKQDLRPLPSLPGVRPVELTSKRMERIMRLGQGCRRRSPWWCWAVMIVAAAVVLPGAARMVAAQSRPLSETAREPKALSSLDEVAKTPGEQRLMGKPVQISTPTAMLTADSISINVPANASAPDKVKSTEKSNLIIVKAYDVDDLVAPITNSIVGTSGVKKFTKEDEARQVKESFKPLIELITSTVEPHSWKMSGGGGTIQAYEKNNALVISQTEEVHAEVVDLLAQLRRLQDIQIGLDVQRIEMAGDVFKQTEIELDKPDQGTILSSREARLFWMLAGSKAKDSVLQAPRVTVFNGQLAQFGFGDKTAMTLGPDTLKQLETSYHQAGFEHAHIEPVGGNGMLQIQPVVSDTKTVQLTLVGKKPITVWNDQTVLFDITGLFENQPAGDGVKSAKPKGRRVFVAITPKVVISRKAQEQSKKTKNETATRSVSVSMGMVRPTIIFLEEEEERIAAGPVGP